MAMKSIVLVSLLVVVFASSQAEAQLDSGFLVNVISINGTLFCSLNGNIVPNAATPTPAFANALVQLFCGGNVVSSAITDSAGIFNFYLNPLQFLVSTVISSCQLVVATPLATCDASLPAVGVLQAPLQLVGTVVRGLLNVLNLVPGTFQLVGV